MINILVDRNVVTNGCNIICCSVSFAVDMSRYMTIEMKKQSFDVNHKQLNFQGQ